MPDSDYLALDADIIKDSTFADLPVDQRLALARVLVEHSVNSFGKPLAYNGYADVDVHYVSCLKDLSVSLSFQKAMVDAVRRVTERKVVVHDFDAGHAPNVSRPDDLAALVREIVEAE